MPSLHWRLAPGPKVPIYLTGVFLRPQGSVAAEHSIKSDLSAVAIEPVEVQKGVFQVEGAKEDQRGGSRPCWH